MQTKLTKDINEYTKEEFLEIENFGDPNAEFNAIIIVPTGELHDSGFQTMKFILTKDRDMVMACSGWSDVIHINGIGGYGRYGTKEREEALYKQRVRRVGWSIDCLAKSGCVRLFTSKDKSVMISINQAIEKLKKLGYDAYASYGDSLIHFRLPISQMNQKYYDKINADLKQIGWDKSWGATGNGR